MKYKYPETNPEILVSKLKEKVKNEFEREIKFVEKIRLEELTKLDKKSSARFQYFVYYYLIYKTIMEREVDDYCPTLLSGYKYEFPIEMFNLLLDSNTKVLQTILMDGVDFNTILDDPKKFRIDTLSVIEENFIKKKWEKDV